MTAVDAAPDTVHDTGIDTGSDAGSDTAPGPKPVTEGPKRRGEQFGLYVFVVTPFLALLAAVPVAWGWGLGWTDIVLATVFYVISGLGITVGYHRYFTHRSFAAGRGLKIALAIAGSLAIEGPIVRWVADHRRHHAFSDRVGDPHSPWRYGVSRRARLRGLAYAHVGWLFDTEHTNRERFAPDLLADRDVMRIDRLFLLWVVISMGAPPLLGGLITWSVGGAVSAFFWASLVRVCLLHHVTWSINSICHTFGARPFETRDQSSNVWPLAILSFGESWHNLHHADPTAARHGVLPGQLDSSARVIWLFEKLGWATDARWTSPQRLAKLRG
jgi:stearoyl-CoA desaturase (delta-9 desaturase)